MLRFMSCAIVLYVGFLIAGWVIIGPYSMKVSSQSQFFRVQRFASRLQFRTLGESSEALFSLMNGDDMFATFYTINDSNTTIKVRIASVYFYGVGVLVILKLTVHCLTVHCNSV